LLMSPFDLPGRIAKGEQQANKCGWSAGAILSGITLLHTLSFFCHNWNCWTKLNQWLFCSNAILFFSRVVRTNRIWYKRKVTARILVDIFESWYISWIILVHLWYKWYILEWPIFLSRCKWRRHFATLRQNMVWRSSRPQSGGMCQTYWAFSSGV
jgi:hypothetical protein